MIALLYALISAFIVSLIGLAVFFALYLQDKFLKKTLIYLVSFSAGGLMGGAFFHLLPESLEQVPNPLVVFIFLLVGFCAFFILEKFLRWHHCHNKECHSHAHLGYLNLIGDSVHNLIDGIIIASTYVVSIPLGIVTTISIISHEIPQELGDFGVLLYSGMTKKKAMLYNFMVALLAVVGVFIGYFLTIYIHGITGFLIPAAAGGFIYIAATDLIPELQEEINAKSSVKHFGVFILALVFMYFVKILGE
ncbi:MAG: ZIP family metal transporter [Candidatus Parcubacteria bacterium]|nr:ZIP family metal transporter [Candidatus Parcubacteria bacterium]